MTDQARTRYSHWFYNPYSVGIIGGIVAGLVLFVVSFWVAEYQKNQPPIASCDHFEISSGEICEGNIFKDNGEGPDCDFDGIFVLDHWDQPPRGEFTMESNGDFRFDSKDEFSHLSEGEVEPVRICYWIQDDLGAKSTATIEIDVHGVQKVNPIVFPVPHWGRHVWRGWVVYSNGFGAESREITLRLDKENMGKITKVTVEGLEDDPQSFRVNGSDMMFNYLEGVFTCDETNGANGFGTLEVQEFHEQGNRILLKQFSDFSGKTLKWSALLKKIEDPTADTNKVQSTTSAAGPNGENY